MIEHWVPSVALDLFSCVILLILLVNRRYNRGRFAQLDRRLLSWMIVGNIVLLLLDALSWYIDGRSFPHARECIWLTSILLYAMQPVPALIYLLYCGARLGKGQAELRRRLPIYAIPVLVNLIVVALSPIYPLFFYIDAQNVYTRAFMFFYSFLLAYAPLLSAITHVYLYSRRMRRELSNKTGEVYWPLMLFPIPPIVGGVLQIWLPDISLIWPSTVVSMLIIILNIQNSEIITDALTGLFNRRRTDQYLQYCFANASAARPLTIVSMDVDSFKRINDTFGHAAGDKALQVVARTLMDMCSSREFVGRYGGDEFLLISSGSRESVLAITQFVNARLAHACERLRLPYKLALSMGIAQKTEDIQSADALLALADTALYTQKAGKFKRRANDRT